MDIRLGHIREALLRESPDAEKALELGFRQFRNVRVIPDSDPLCCMQASVSLWIAINEKASECGLGLESVAKLRILIRRLRSELPANMCAVCQREVDRVRVEISA